MLLSLSLLKSLKLIVCLYVSDWYLLRVNLSLSHTHIGTFRGPIEISRRTSPPFLNGSPPPPPPPLPGA